MHRVGAGLGRHRQQLVDVEVGLGRGGPTEGERLVGGAHVQRVGVGVGVDRDGAQAVVGAGAGDAHGDLTAVRDQHGAQRAGGLGGGGHRRRHRCGA